MRLLIAFDKFKDSMAAKQACLEAKSALENSGTGLSLDLCPLADGGDGFAEILTDACGGGVQLTQVTGPLGNPIRAGWGSVALSQVPGNARGVLTGVPAAGQLSVADMASASGLALVPKAHRSVWRTTSAGTGDLLLAAAVDAAGIVVGVGGSATHDLGLGALGRLGFRCLDAFGRDIRLPVPSEWVRIRSIVREKVPNLPPVYVACDVTNPLLGADGAAAVFGPQKGASPGDIALLDGEGARLASLLCEVCGVPAGIAAEPSMGAAGGMAFALRVALGARVVPGSALVAQWLRIDNRIRDADVVVTGEGRFDASSLSGKGPADLIARARAAGKPVHVFAGVVDSPRPIEGVTFHAITPEGTPQEQALAAGPQNLRAAVAKAFAP
jgi:glycerate 2-kinase